MNLSFDRLLPLLKITVAAFILSSFVACTSYKEAGDHLYDRGNYYGAIENYDVYLTKSNNGVNKTQIERKRATAYYRLGMQAVEEDNLNLAIRFFYLANFLQADEKLVETYLNIGDNFIEQGSYDEALSIYNYIIDTFPTLPAIPQTIEYKIILLHNYYKDKHEIWRNYVLMVDRYGEDTLNRELINIVDTYIKDFVVEILDRKTDSNQDELIDQLLYFARYPNRYVQEIHQEVGLLYQELGKIAEADNDFIKAEKHLRLAAKYNPGIEKQVLAQLDGMVDKMIKYGDKLLVDRKVEEAIQIFNHTFAIVPNNQPAKNAILKAEEKKRNIEEGKALYTKALKSENDDEYQKALNLYKQAYTKDPIKEYSEKIFLMDNMIEIEKDAVGFAKKIITSHNRDSIPKRLNQIESNLRADNGDDVMVSGWRVMLSTGSYKYEVRYDITSKTDNYYFIWQVNLLNRQITPLNKESREAMEN
ncbi:MAG: hypothetical protein WCX83_02710 [Candidatus Cloacimonas sp.]|nr:hypothetical protein [Candidatus Cloacimonadota bacterium]